MSLRALRRATIVLPPHHRYQTRTFLSLFRKKQELAPSKILLSQDDLFHPLSKSPIPALRKRGELVRSLAPCPVCLEEHGERRAVQHECPDCGWPTHASEEHWARDHEHDKYCSRLREANEDMHDLHSGRRLVEFELPAQQGYEETVSFANWDVYWFTRNHPSIDTERSRRHLSKLLTYPVTISSVLHEFSGMTLRNQRVTPEGARSLAALRTTLHQRPDASKSEEDDERRLVRVFILGARAEAALPSNVWQQLPYLFPGCRFHVFFVGPQVPLPASATQQPKSPKSSEDPSSETDSKTLFEPRAPATGQDPSRTRNREAVYGVPSFTTAVSPTLTLTSLQATYSDVHAQFASSLDPFQDVFFAFSPGFGFPSPTDPNLTQLASPAEWGGVLPLILESKCALFVTGFSPTDMERDVRALDGVEGVSGEFDWILTPGANAFGSEKWEVADFDPRVMVKINWGVWGIRGKRREVKESRED